MKLVLAGFMGSGKSTVAAQLGQRLNLPVIEMDERIVALSGLPSVQEIFAQRGEAEFRRLEQQVCQEISDCDNVIVSTGGGVVQDAQNVVLLKQNHGCIIYLETDFSTIVERIGNSHDRPLFTEVEKAEQLYRLREPVYQDVADLTVKTDLIDLHAVVAEILERMDTPE